MSFPRAGIHAPGLAPSPEPSESGDGREFIPLHQLSPSMVALDGQSFHPVDPNHYSVGDQMHQINLQRAHQQFWEQQQQYNGAVFYPPQQPSSPSAQQLFTAQQMHDQHAVNQTSSQPHQPQYSSSSSDTASQISQHAIHPPEPHPRVVASIDGLASRLQQLQQNQEAQSSAMHLFSTNVGSLFEHQVQFARGAFADSFAELAR